MKKNNLVFLLLTGFFIFYNCKDEDEFSIASEIVGSYIGNVNLTSSDDSSKLIINVLSDDKVDIRVSSLDNSFEDVDFKGLKVTKETRIDTIDYIITNDTLTWGSIYKTSANEYLNFSWTFDNTHKFFYGVKVK